LTLGVPLRDALFARLVTCAVLLKWGKTTMAVLGVVDPAFFAEPS